MTRFEENMYVLKKAKSICAKQEKCREDIRKKLFEWEINTRDHEWMLDSLVKEGFIDETRYAGFFVRDKFKFNKWGKIKINYELHSRNIPEKIIQEALGSINNEEYEEVCYHLLKLKFESIKDNEFKQIKDKLLRYGSSKGFESGLIIKLTEKLFTLYKIQGE